MRTPRPSCPRFETGCLGTGPNGRCPGPDQAPRTACALNFAAGDPPDRRPAPIRSAADPIQEAHARHYREAAAWERKAHRAHVIEEVAKAMESLRYLDVPADALPLVDPAMTRVMLNDGSTRLVPGRLFRLLQELGVGL